MCERIKIQIYADPNNSNPTLTLPDIPWFPGLTVLQAMIIGISMHSADLSFGILYRSSPICGAAIDSINGVSNGDRANHYWSLYMNGQETVVGAGETILLWDVSRQTALVEWRYTDASAELMPAA